MKFERFAVHQSKIEQAQEKVEQLRAELRTQVQDEVRANLRARTWRQFFLRLGGCCGIYLVALLTIPLLTSYLVARTGLVTVPWLSDRVAHERAPVRVVVPVAGDAKQFLATKLRGASRSGEQPSQIGVTLTEGELTGLFRSAFEARGSSASAGRSVAQVVVRPDGVELFARIPSYGGSETTIIVRGVPTVRDGKLVADVTDAAIGNLGVPRMLAAVIARSFLGQLPELRFEGDEVFPAARIEAISLSDAALRLVLRMTP